MVKAFIPPTPDSAPAQKDALRKEMQHKRFQVTEDMANTAGWKAANFLRSLIAKHQPEIVSLYMAMKNEIDLTGLVKDLHPHNNLHVELALPRVAKKGFPLVFNKWYPGAKLDFDKMGLDCAKGVEVYPSMMAMPCLAFSRNGGRLGYGGGYYDMTLRKIEHPVITVAVAYSFQEVEDIPMEYHDQPVDYVITENELIQCR